MSKSEFRARLKSRTFSQKGNPLKLKKPPRQSEPKNIEREFQRDLSKRFAVIRERVESQIIPAIRTTKEEDDALKPRTDSVSGSIAALIAALKQMIKSKLSERELRLLARKIAADVSIFNMAQIKKVTPVDVFLSEPYLTDQIDSFVEQNVLLIKSVDEQVVTQIQESVYRGVRSGQGIKAIASDIRKKMRTSEKRARFIARDQVNKFNGQLSMLRQKNLGLNRYIWRTSMDERVRPAHSSREGKWFSWDQPPFDGHPGEAINCRCYAEPVIEDVLEEEITARRGSTKAPAKKKKR